MDQIEMDQEQEQQQNTEQAENALEDFVDPASVVSLPVNMKVGYMYSFLFQHLHRSFKGIFGVCISIAALDRGYHPESNPAVDQSAVYGG